MDKIKIKIDGRIAEIESAPEVVTDNAEYEVEFAVDERDGWNPTVPMTALFVRRDARYTAVVMDAGETICTMPPQTGTNIVYVGLTQDDMRTTTPATIKVYRSIRTLASDPLPAPTEDVYAQILAAYAGIKILSGKGAPTLTTQGKVNQLYRDEDTQRLYICTATDGGYTWAAVVSDTEDAVTYTAQTLTEEQKTQARANIGAGTSNFSGSYNDLNDQPNIPAATVIDTTLTKSGQAADAKAAGDAIRGKIDAPQTAQVGEVLTVEEVDEYGKPIKWKTAPGVNIITELTQESTDSQVPSAKAAYDAIQNATDKDAVRFVAQELTEEQKEQARKNINATPKLYYLPKEKIASAVVSEYQTSDHKWRKRFEYNNVLLSLPADRNIFLCGDNQVTIIKTETDGQIQFNIDAGSSIKVEKAEFKNYFGYLYFATIVLTVESNYSSQLQNLYASAMGMTIDPVLIGMANSDGKPGLIKICAQEYNSIAYNPLVLDENGYAMSYNEFSITTASDVGFIFRTQKAKAILVTDEIPVFFNVGFDPPYFMTQLSTNFYDGEITNNYMVVSPMGMFFAQGKMSIRGASNTVYWTYDSSQISMSLPLIYEALEELSVNTLRSPTTAQVGQIIKVKAVNANGKITQTEAVDMPTQKTLKWITVHSSDLTEETTEIVVSADPTGKAIADYNPVGLTLIISTPADATQTDNNGAPWVYPSATKKDNAIRVIGSIAGWKTTARDSVFGFYGGSSAMTCTGNGNLQLATYKIDGYALDGVTVMLNGNTNHFPVGTHVEVAILCEVAATM